MSKSACSGQTTGTLRLGFKLRYNTLRDRLTAAERRLWQDGLGEHQAGELTHSILVLFSSENPCHS